MDEKLQKVLARAGLGSRRELEEWIKSGRVKVNGELATLGDRVSAKDRIHVDGRLFRTDKPRTRVIAYHKPIGEICTRSDPEGRPTIFDKLPKLRSARWVAIGRLDINTCGLILLTTDGELANHLMHPSSKIEREYAARVMGQVSEDMITLLKKGVLLEDGEARFDNVRYSGGEGVNQWYHVTLKEGRYREVRRLWEAIGVTVSRLMRIRFGSYELGRRLRPGNWAELSDEDIQQLRVVAGLAKPALKPGKTTRKKPGKSPRTVTGKKPGPDNARRRQSLKK